MRRLGVGILFLLCLSATLFAQTTGKMTGTIKDGTTGEPLIGVNVVLEDTYLGAASDVDGKFFILNIPPGKYTVKFMLIGYTTKVVEGVSVSVNRTTPIDLTMDATMLELGEEVVVTADRIAVKKDQTSSIRNVSAEDMEILPIESTGGVVALQPGVVQGHFRGGRSNETNVMIDGVSVQSGLNRGSMVSVDPDAVQEVEVITGTFSAKYGEAMSGVVNMVTKEGGNKFSGKVEGFMGNYLTQHGDVYKGLDIADINRNEDYKFMFEGPIIRNRLNFFVSGRVQDNDGYLNGIRRFNITDEPDYSQFQDSTLFDPVTGEYLLNEHSGDSSFVPMSWMEGYNLNAKLTYRMQNIKASLMYLINNGTGQGYSHGARFKPDGRSRWHDRSDLWTLQLNHVLGQRLFYELKFSYTYSKTGSYLYENPLDGRYLHDRYAANQSYTGFVTGGQDKGHNTNETNKFLSRLDMTWQATNNHSLEFGAEAVRYEYDQASHSILNLYRNTQASAFLSISAAGNHEWTYILQEYEDFPAIPALYPVSRSYFRIRTPRD